MKIAIIGAGISGLAVGWLLQPRYEVTVFERSHRAGGHAHSIPVDLAGHTIWVDVGAQAFIPSFHTLFRRLLDIIGVPVVQWPVSMAIVNRLVDQTHVLPPLGLHQQLRALKPAHLRALLSFRRFMQAATDLVHSGDWSITLEAFVEQLDIPISVKETFIWPLLTTVWTQSSSNIRRSTAYSILKYFVYAASGGSRRFQTWAVKDGCATYVRQLCALLPDVRCNSAVTAIARDQSGWRLSCSGSAQRFEHIIFAISARDALPLLCGVPQLARQHAVLAMYEYFSVNIAVHSDPHFYMPDRRSDWAITNHSWGADGHALTFWSGWQQDVPLFKSWTNFCSVQPRHVHAEFEFHHPISTPNHFMAQQALAGVQGRHNIWFVGTHTHDVDSHESALRSSIDVARRLAPRSPRLLQLVDRRT